MANAKHITLERIHQLVVYNPETGDFTYLPRDASFFKPTAKRTPEWLSKWWNARFANKPAGGLHHSGYIHVRIGESYKIPAHILAWFYVYGEWRYDDIDHKNGDRSDNRLENLRIATQSEQMCNRSNWNFTTDFPKGISKNGNGFKARIQKDGKRVSLGTFKTIEEAVEAYERAARDLHGDFRRQE
jgi:hypothetical protein